MIVPGGEVPGAAAARSRHPNRRVGLLDGTRPEIDHGKLEVLAVPGENLPGLPGLHDQVVGLVIPVPLLHRGDPVAEVHVQRRSQGHTRHQPSTADAVQHGVLFRHPGRRIGCGEGRAHLYDGHVHAVGGPGQHRAHQVGSRHEAVGVLVVLVDADAVQSGLGGIDQFVQGPVIVLAYPLRVGQLPPGRVDPDGVVAVLEVLGKLPMRHKVEHGDFDRPPPSPKGQ